MFGKTELEYVDELKQVLKTKDLEQLKIFYQKWQKVMELPVMPSDKELEVEMHRLICELPDLQDMHQESQEWLLLNGYSVWLK